MSVVIKCKVLVFRYAITNGLWAAPAMAHPSVLASGQVGMRPDFSAQPAVMG